MAIIGCHRDRVGATRRGRAVNRATDHPGTRIDAQPRRQPGCRKAQCVAAVRVREVARHIHADRVAVIVALIRQRRVHNRLVIRAIDRNRKGLIGTCTIAAVGGATVVGHADRNRDGFRFALSENITWREDQSVTAPRRGGERRHCVEQLGCRVTGAVRHAFDGEGDYLPVLVRRTAFFDRLHEAWDSLGAVIFADREVLRRSCRGCVVDRGHIDGHRLRCGVEAATIIAYRKGKAVKAGAVCVRIWRVDQIAAGNIALGDDVADADRDAVQCKSAGRRQRVDADPVHDIRLSAWLGEVEVTGCEYKSGVLKSAYGAVGPRGRVVHLGDRYRRTKAVRQRGRTAGIVTPAIFVVAVAQCDRDVARTTERVGSASVAQCLDNRFHLRGRRCACEIDNKVGTITAAADACDTGKGRIGNRELIERLAPTVHRSRDGARSELPQSNSRRDIKIRDGRAGNQLLWCYATIGAVAFADSHRGTRAAKNWRIVDGCDRGVQLDRR